MLCAPKLAQLTANGGLDLQNRRGLWGLWVVGCGLQVAGRGLWLSGGRSFSSDIKLVSSSGVLTPEASLLKLGFAVSIQTL